MSSIHIPDSTIELTDGSIVMLNRFPGTKWVVHEGWYTYNGRQYSGWYFCSIPANTVLPVNEQDLSALVVVSCDSPDVDPPVPPMPPRPPVPPYPPYPPYPPVPPYPPHPPHPPVPPKPEPGPDEPAFFSVKLKAQLDSAFISVPNLRQRDAFITDELPNGKIIRVNSVEGTPRYYVWNKVDDEWQDLDFAFKSDIDQALDNVYTKEDIDDKISDINSELESLHTEIVSVAESSQESLDSAVEAIESHIAEEVSRLEAEIGSIESPVDELREALAETQQNLEDLTARVDASEARVDQNIAEILDRIVILENALFDIQKLISITSENKVIVSHEGSIADSDYSIGDGIIGESSEYADLKTLATEKAVAKLVEDSMPMWGSF